MSEGKWSGSIANRRWERRRSYAAPDPERDTRLYQQLASEIFWCEICGRTHPLREHRDCRTGPR